MANSKGHTMSLVSRLLIVAAVTVSISVVTAILLIQKYGAMWNVVPVMVFAIIVPATLAMAINYLYWRPRYRMSTGAHTHFISRRQHGQRIE
jgi:nicotinamide riboside transporter PnuC